RARTPQPSIPTRRSSDLVAYRRFGVLRSSDPDQRQLVALAGVTDRWIPVTDDVRNTHDEALAVDRRLRQFGARSIVLVTSPMHTDRKSTRLNSSHVAISY